MLTHANLMGISAAIQNEFEIYETDVHLSYLPLPHVFEKLLMVGFLYKGASIGFY
jgi:long-chain acyl-CoA synthetase